MTRNETKPVANQLGGRGGGMYQYLQLTYRDFGSNQLCAYSIRVGLQGSCGYAKPPLAVPPCTSLGFY